MSGSGTKILVISEVFYPEEFLVNDLVFEWQRQGHQVSVLTRNPSYPQGKVFPGYRNRMFQREVVNGVQVVRVQFIPGYKSGRLLKILNYLWNMLLAALWSIRNGKKFDTVYIYQTGPLTFSLAGVLIRKFYRKPVTIWVQDVWPDTVFAYGMATRGFSRMVLERFVRWVYANCDHITASSPGFLPLISRYCPSKTIRFIPQWSLTSGFTGVKAPERNTIFPGRFNFIFAGNLGKVQNLENVISGFGLYQEAHPGNEVWLNLLGDGSHRQYLEDMVARQQTSHVKFWGRKDVAEMPMLYAAADVLLISLENKPIFNLTIPAKFQSYLNAEKPMFGIIGGEVAGLITGNSLGWVAAPDDLQDIARAFADISRCTSETLHAKTANARSLLAEKFNRETLIRQITDIVCCKNHAE
jgi:glycosyltransferase involved in cell wall biosynthesis